MCGRSYRGKFDIADKKSSILSKDIEKLQKYVKISSKKRKLFGFGMTQDEAHKEASKKYNYQEAVIDVRNKKFKR